MAWPQVICLLVDELCLGSCASRLLERLPQLHASNASDSDANSPQPDVSPCSEADVALCRGQIAALHGSRKGTGSPAPYLFRPSPHAMHALQNIVHNIC